MRTRYPTNMALALLGGFTVVVSLALPVSAFEWLMFAAGIATVAVSAGAAPLPGRGLYQRATDAPLAVLGIWTIIASLVFGGATVTWLGFASGCAMVALTVIAMSIHEARSERVIHTLEVATVPGDAVRVTDARKAAAAL